MVERAFTLEQLAEADEVIVSSSGNLCTFADQLDGKPVGGRDRQSLRKLRDAAYGEFLDQTGFDVVKGR